MKKKSQMAFHRPWPRTYPARPKMVSKRKAQKLPIPKGPNLGSIQTIRQVLFNTTRFFLSLQENYGEVASFYLNRKLYIGLFSPEQVYNLYTEYDDKLIKGLASRKTRKIVGDGIITSEDPIHKQHKKMMQPSFHKNKIETYVEDMYKEIIKHTQKWDNKNQIELVPEILDLTLKIVSKNLFSIDANKYSKTIAENLEIAVDRIATTMLPSLTLLDNSPLPWFRKYRDAAYNLSEIMDNILAERKTSGKTYDDLLSLLSEAVDENGNKFTESELKEEALTIILSGHETTANLITWAILQLNSNPIFLERLRKEAEESAWIKENRAPSIDELYGSMEVANIIKETLRLHPPLWTTMRQAIEEIKTDKIYIPKGANVFVSQYVSHRNPKYFPEPRQWNPDRWLNNFEKTLPKGAYFPFGYGGRRCIGSHFAMIEASLVLLYVAYNYDIRYTEKNRALPKIRPRASLRPKGKVVVQVTKK